MGASLLFSAAFSLAKARVPPRYEASVVMRVADGMVDSRGNNLGGGALRAHVNDFAFTSRHLAELVARHPEAFPSADKDPVSVFAAIREQMIVSITDSDFIEERGPGDPARAARITVGYRAATPEVAWTIAHELGELLVGSTLARERVALEREAEAATDALKRAQAALAALAELSPAAPGPTGTDTRLRGTDTRLRAARERWLAAQAAAAAARIDVRAAAEKQTLRFEIVDAGRVPVPVDKVATLVDRLLWSFLTALVVAWLLAGAFDPRVLDVDDLESLGIASLGQLPALPSRTASGARGAPAARV